LRNNTERPITVTQGTNVLVGLNPDRIVAAASAAIKAQRCYSTRIDHWDGLASKRILDVLTEA
jgi:UDP-N-acetylglucosamine 2-epimerase (non-hydrolysing)